MSEPTILFVCLHGAAKSVIAASHCQRLANDAGVFIHATFAGTVNFDDVRAGVLEFVNARFEKRAWIGALTADEVNLARVRCAAMTEVDVRVDRLNTRLARFEEGVVIRANGGSVFADYATLSGAGQFQETTHPPTGALAGSMPTSVTTWSVAPRSWHECPASVGC